MVYTAIDTFYLTDKQLQNTPSRKDGIDEVTETTLRRYGCDLIQESGILLNVPQQVMGAGQVLFHRFYCKQSFARFNVKRIAASCIWLASKLEENIKTVKEVLIVFHGIECKRENIKTQHLDASSKKYLELETDLKKCELQILKEMGYICHVELPHKLMIVYLETLQAPHHMKQEAWNLACDSLRTTLCVRFQSHVVALACGVIYAAARRCYVPLPETPPWWEVFDTTKKEIDEVCRVLANLYSSPKSDYINVCKEDGSFTMSNMSLNSPSETLHKVEEEAVLKRKERVTEERIKEKEEERKRKRHKSRDCKRDRYWKRKGGR